MKLTVRDVSGLLDVSEKTVYRWVNERKLPGYRLSGQYRFNRAEIIEWATANKINVAPDAFHESEATAQPLPSLAEALQAGGIFHRVAGADKSSALRGVVEVLPLPEGVDRDFLHQVLIAREQLASTGIGDGIAIPHARNPIVLHVDKPMVTLCFLEKPIEFDALDGQPVHALFTLISPTARAHLHLLSRLAFALRDEGFKALIHREAGRDELFSAARQLSREMDARQSAKGTGEKESSK